MSGGPTALADVVVADGRARARVSRAHAEALAAGHFPGDPIVPGALLAGLMAELAGHVAAGRALAEIVRCVFLAPVRPADTIAVEARAEGPSLVEAIVCVGGAPAVRATLRFAEGG